MKSIWKVVKLFYAIHLILVLLLYNRWIFSIMKAKVFINNFQLTKPIFFIIVVDVSLLKQFSQPTENKAYMKECIQRETGYIRQAMRCKIFKAQCYKSMIVFRSFGKGNCLCNIFET